jgi:hypothetical protein
VVQGSAEAPRRVAAAFQCVVVREPDSGLRGLLAKRHSKNASTGRWKLQVRLQRTRTISFSSDGMLRRRNSLQKPERLNQPSGKRDADPTIAHAVDLTSVKLDHLCIQRFEADWVVAADELCKTF